MFQNFLVEFVIFGDFKVVERLISQFFGFYDFYNVQCIIKVLFIDMGVIFGNVVYEGVYFIDMNVVILNDLYVDIMDYIQFVMCSEMQFRIMWIEFEWENKVNINSKVKMLRDFLDQLMVCMNMNCLMFEVSLKGDCQFLSVNLYVRSVFGKFLFFDYG